MNAGKGKDRLIVALDVTTTKEAVDLVRELNNVNFFKVNLSLLMSGDVIKALRDEREGHIFLDIKWGGDIGNTAADFMQACIASKVVKFITLIEASSIALTKQTIRAMDGARKAASVDFPRLLMVPYFSSLDATDLKETQGIDDLDSYILRRAEAMLNLGCDGLILSGTAIKACREKLGEDISIVSPGIRPIGSPRDDQKRHTTPRQAIEFGADYLVVGRPIINAPDKKDAAQRVIDEIDDALAKGRGSYGGSNGATSMYHTFPMAAKGY